MRIDGIRIEGGEVILTTNDPAARRIAYDFKPGEYELKKVRKKRSINANDLCWVYCEQISKAVGIDKEEVYRRNIRQAGVFERLPIKAEAVSEFQRRWKSKGVGWFADVIDDSKLKGYKLIFAYYGSSTYTVQEMSRLIESIIQDAKSIGLETLTEREKSLLLEGWSNGESETD